MKNRKAEKDRSLNRPIWRVSRRIGLSILQAVGRDITIKHHWIPGQKLKLHSFKHKGYWWRGKEREGDTLISVNELLKPGCLAIDVGAHVGYLTQYFAHLVGPMGHVVAFEPSEDNLIYTRPNIAMMGNVKLEECGISDYTGEARFFVESLTGQNNSLIEDYEVLNINAENAGVDFEKREIVINVTTIDEYCAAKQIRPDFIKIDIEGAETAAVNGMEQVLKNIRPIVLVEMSKDIMTCFDLFSKANYSAFDIKLKPVPKNHFHELEKRNRPVNFFWKPN